MYRQSTLPCTDVIGYPIELSLIQKLDIIPSNWSLFEDPDLACSNWQGRIFFGISLHELVQVSMMLCQLLSELRASDRELGDQLHDGVHMHEEGDAGLGELI